MNMITCTCEGCGEISVLTVVDNYVVENSEHKLLCTRFRCTRCLEDFWTSAIIPTTYADVVIDNVVPEDPEIENGRTM